ncbi:MAG: hypothetical protein FJ098_15350, partial [Deltaproteobacteria bacterium]|nr:hypothetical protein [Deltaproteobacteria bacterium]
MSSAAVAATVPVTATVAATVPVTAPVAIAIAAAATISLTAGGRREAVALPQRGLVGEADLAGAVV